MKNEAKKDWRFYYDELRGEECSCGRYKKPGYSFCYRCYKSLPRDFKRDLYQRIGAGYEQAYDAAVQYLGA